jgi:phage tail sheath protein FI
VTNPLIAAIDKFRTSGIGTKDLKYGAVYAPNIETTIDFSYDQSEVEVSVLGAGAVKLDTLAEDNNKYYELAKTAISDLSCKMPPSGAIAGIYAAVDEERGVWKAPGNVSLTAVIKPTIACSAADQGNMNVDTVAGKSVNVIRAFTGKGTLVWGARTLAGNDNEWRYINVRRFFNMVEESTKKATEAFVFEPNDANTWVRVQAMVENFLTTLWRQGALQGVKPEHAFYVAVGLGKTMTALDILEGRMIVEIGLAAVRPAEFIILRFSHKMAES